MRILVLATLALLGACAPERASREADGRRALDELRAAHLAALHANDLDAYVALFTADARSLAPGGPTAEGREAIAALVRPILEAFEMTEEETPRGQWIGRDRAAEWGDLRVRVAPRGGDGPLAEARGSYLFLMRREAGEWRFTHMIWNAADPAPPQTGEPAGPTVVAADRELTARVEECFSAWSEAAQREDRAALAALCTSDAVLLPPGEPPCLGRPAVAARGSVGVPRFTLEELIDAGGRVFAVGRIARARGGVVGHEKFVAVLREAGEGLRFDWWLWAPGG